MKIRYLAALSLGMVIATTTFAGESKKDAAPPDMTAEQKAMLEAWEKAATPGDAHKQLVAQFEGTWTTRQTMWMDPSKPHTLIATSCQSIPAPWFRFAMSCA